MVPSTLDSRRKDRLHLVLYHVANLSTVKGPHKVLSH